MSFELARLCTRVHEDENERYKLRRWTSESTKYNTIKAYQCQGVGHLPQGAPTSPMLSNLVMRTFDVRVERYAVQRGLTYSRYADDLIFSTAAPEFGRKSARSLVQAMNRMMRQVGLIPHSRKVSISPPGARKVVLGLLVDTERPRLRGEYKKSIQHNLYAIEKFGVEQHARSRGWKSTIAMRLHLEGVLNYAFSVEPEFATPLIRRWEAIFGAARTSLSGSP